MAFSAGRRRGASALTPISVTARNAWDFTEYQVAMFDGASSLLSELLQRTAKSLQTPAEIGAAVDVGPKRWPARRRAAGARRTLTAAINVPSAKCGKPLTLHGLETPVFLGWRVLVPDAGFTVRRLEREHLRSSVHTAIRVCL
jgi:hypothetical protein